MGSYCVRSTEFQCEMMKIWGIGSDGSTTLRMYLVPLTCTSTNGYNDIMLHIFYHDKMGETCLRRKNAIISLVLDPMPTPWLGAEVTGWQ